VAGSHHDVADGEFVAARGDQDAARGDRRGAGDGAGGGGADGCGIGGRHDAGQGLAQGDHRVAAGTFGGEALVEQGGHGGVGGAPVAGVELDADQHVPVAHGGGDEVEAGEIGEAGLHADAAGVEFQHSVDIGDRAAFEHEARDREQVAVLGIGEQDVAGEDGHVVRIGDLTGIGQAGRVVELGVQHAEGAGLRGHGGGGAGDAAAAEILAESGCGIVGGQGGHAQHGLTDGDGLAGHQIEFDRLDIGGGGGDRDGGIGRQGARAQGVEGEIEGHQLGQAGGEAFGIGVVLGQDGAGVDVHHDPVGSRGDRAIPDREGVGGGHGLGKGEAGTEREGEKTPGFCRNPDTQTASRHQPHSLLVNNP
jgi:hypothetical protein